MVDKIQKVENTTKSFFSKIFSSIWVELKSIFSATSIKSFFAWTWKKINAIFTAMKAANKSTWIKWGIGFGVIAIVVGIFFGVLKCDISKKAIAKYEEITTKEKTKSLKNNKDLIDIIDQVDDTIK